MVVSFNRILYICTEQQIPAPYNNMVDLTDIILSGRIHNMIHSCETKEQAKVIVGDRSQDDGYLWKGVISEWGARNVLFVAMSGDMGIGAYISLSCTSRLAQFTCELYLEKCRFICGGHAMCQALGI